MGVCFFFVLSERIDLRKVKVTEIDGTENTVDISQRIAQEL